jgi:hypothetical protein
VVRLFAPLRPVARSRVDVLHVVFGIALVAIGALG